MTRLLIGWPGVSPRGSGSSARFFPRMIVTTPSSSSTRVRKPPRSLSGSKPSRSILCSCGGNVIR